MKRSILFFAAALTMLISPMTRAEGAQPLTDQYIASIKTGCSSALQGLIQVEKTEAVTRVNRGREYETLLKLAAAFNSRIVLNKLDAPILTSNAAKLAAKFSTFQQDYLSYADKIDATLAINCKEAPVTFYDNLTAARDARNLVANDVRDMDSILDEYQKGLDVLKIELSKPVTGTQP